MNLDELYNIWYDGNRYDPIFVLMCFNILQCIIKPSYSDNTARWKYDQLSDGIRYAMEDWLYDNK